MREVIETSEEMIFEKYKFSEFTILQTSTVRFKVTSNSYEVTVDDENYIKDAINSNLGMWESLIKTGLQVFSELGIIHLEQGIPEEYERPFGVELYEVTTSTERPHDWIWAFISLTTEERHRRQNANLNPLLQVEEIKGQLSNITKWKNFSKTMKIIKEQWRSR